MIYKCGICGYLYDEETEGKRWDQLDEEWVCPFCTASKSIFFHFHNTDEKSHLKFP